MPDADPDAYPDAVITFVQSKWGGGSQKGASRSSRQASFGPPSQRLSHQVPKPPKLRRLRSLRAGRLTPPPRTRVRDDGAGRGTRAAARQRRGRSLRPLRRGKLLEYHIMYYTILYYTMIYSTILYYDLLHDTIL